MLFKEHLACLFEIISTGLIFLINNLTGCFHLTLEYRTYSFCFRLLPFKVCNVCHTGHMLAN
jgi:hypothetical protein